MQTAVLIPPKWPLKGTLKSPPSTIFPLPYYSNEVLSFLSFFSISTEKQDGNLIYEEQTEANVVVSSCHTISSAVAKWGNFSEVNFIVTHTRIGIPLVLNHFSDNHI